MEHGARGMEIQARKAGKAGKAGKGKSAGSLFRTTEPQSHRATEVGNQRADDRRQRTALRQAQGLAAGG
jgi:hypothetical protein